MRTQKYSRKKRSKWKLLVSNLSHLLLQCRCRNSRCCSPIPVDKVRPVRQLWLKTTSSPFCCCCRCCFANFETTPPKKRKKTNHNDISQTLGPELVPCHSVAMPRLALFPGWKLLLLHFSYNNVTVNRSYRHLLMKTEQFDVTYFMKMWLIIFFFYRKNELFNCELSNDEMGTEPDHSSGSVRRFPFAPPASTQETWDQAKA